MLVDIEQPVLLYQAGNRTLFDNLVSKLDVDTVEVNQRRFPDGESYVRILSDVSGRDVILFCSLDRPDPKFLPMIYTAETLYEEGADTVTLLAPYLAYMRQDRRFNPGEAVTSRQFAQLVSRYFDGLLTVDPHLHRYKTVREIYDISSQVVHADNALSEWIDQNIEAPLLIGPDEESEQWVSEVAEDIDAPYNVLTKTRHGDEDVEITFEDPDRQTDRSTVLIDDIISTAGTMKQATKVLIDNGYGNPTCVGVHAIFAGNAYRELKDAGAKQIVTCNTIDHPSNAIDLSDELLEPFQIP